MRPKSRKKYQKTVLFILSLCSLFLLFSYIDRKMIPPLKEISHFQCKMTANQIIDTSANEILSDMKLTEFNLLIPSAEGNGYTTNTALVNQFCTRFSTEITNRITKISNERIEIPLGAASNWSFFANKGPKIPFTLVPMGTAKVDYASEFFSVGINQINYKIWLNISIELKIVNPLYHENITMERKIMLADIVFSGKVPEHYFQMSAPDEYLLTE
ncbi:sporulation protein YunB [Anaerotignum sp.]